MLLACLLAVYFCVAKQVATSAASKLLLASCSRLLQAPIRGVSFLVNSSNSSNSAICTALGSTSPHTTFQASHLPQQQEQEPQPQLWPLQGVGRVRQISSSSSASSQQPQDPQQRGATPTEEAKNLSKAFLTSVLDAEDLWLKGVAGQLKMWAATKKIALEVRLLRNLVDTDVVIKRQLPEHSCCRGVLMYACRKIQTSTTMS
jgi:hypothetical protein